MRQAIILSIGDELVLGQTVDTNSAYLSAELAKRGIGTLYHHTVADDQPAIADAIQLASLRAPLIIISGGLGPTDDDLTRQALAEAMGVKLVVHEPSVEVIRAFFASRDREMPERNRVQAMHPEGTIVIPNPCGTAPGIQAQLNKATIYVTPGVPREMFDMFQNAILPQVLAGREGEEVPSHNTILTCKVNTFGMGESDVADLLGDLMVRTRNPMVGTTVSNGIVSVRVRSEFANADDATREMDATVAAVEQRLGAVVFGHNNEALPDTLVPLLRDAGQVVATAESCTGGLIGKLITDVSGSSSVYAGGWITYTNEMKTSQLGVPAELFEQVGAVSEEVASAMATGALKRSGASLAVSVTGIAGPTGGTEAKPVGTVWIGLAWKDATVGDEIQSRALRFNLSGHREAVRDRAAKCALQMLRFHLTGVSLDTIRWARNRK